jgi:hypothetical protein
MAITTTETSFTLLDLHRAAIFRLRRNDPGFREYQDAVSDDQSLPGVHIYVESKTRFVSLRYGGGLGEGYWIVNFSNDGEISSLSSGIGRDAFIDKSVK